MSTNMKLKGALGGSGLCCFRVSAAMKHFILGAGGVGGLIGGVLARSGESVVIVARSNTHPSSLSIEHFGTFQTAVRVTEQVDEPCEVLWVTEKAHQLDSALERCRRMWRLQHIITKGRNRDTAWFSMLDSEWPARKRMFEQWLDPSNFDESGEQKRRLSEYSEDKGTQSPNQLNAEWIAP